ncbi:SDR family NAD(P)-dependent oxidoreductase [Kutzneria buriramensis]|uniref:SDR family NAD(P)-dependent oxidoreductase n=1 Tax=Kutzneria buriramensis TaxID=1045776 RepID=UPI00319E2692
MTNGRVAVVTGGSRGTGRQTAGRLAADGCDLPLLYVGDDKAADEAVAAIAAAGSQTLPFQTDVADEIAVAAVFDKVEQEFGGLDVVVHAAGMMPLAPLVDLDLAVLDTSLRVNIRGTFVVNQQAARRIRPGGSIVNFSSSITRFCRPGYTAYGASKGAVEAMTLTLARELAGWDIIAFLTGPGRWVDGQVVYANGGAI